MKHAVFAVLALIAAPANADTYKCHPSDASAKISVTFSSTVSLNDLTAWIVGITCKNVVFTPEVAKNATRLVIAAPNEMTPKQALKLFMDSLDAAGLVATDKGDTIVIKPGKGMPTCPDIAAANQPSSVTPNAPEQPAADDLSDAELDAGIKATDATHVTITAKLVDKILANPMAMAKGARVVPAVSNGKPDGFKLYAIRAGSVFDRLGLQNGDTLVSINGLRLDDADKALEAYTKVREAKKLEVALKRKGNDVTLTITIK